MRVLITGGSGLVGNAIVDKLLDSGCEVVCIGRQANQPSQWSNPRLTYIQLDIGLPTFLEQAYSLIPLCDAIVHAAALKSHGIYATDLSMTNCLGTQQILKLAEHWQIKNFVYISSVGVIGKPRQLPVTEEHDIKILTAYHASKIFGEHLTQLTQPTSLKAAILRISSPIGIHNLANNKTILYCFIERALKGLPLEILGKGTRCQNYVDVRDIAAAVLSCLQQQAQGIFNIASDAMISNIDLAKMCIEILASKSAVKWSNQLDADDELKWDISIKKAQELLGYHPQYTIQDSIKRVASYYEYNNDQ